MIMEPRFPFGGIGIIERLKMTSINTKLFLLIVHIASVIMCIMYFYSWALLPSAGQSIVKDRWSVEENMVMRTVIAVLSVALNFHLMSLLHN